MEQKQFGRYVIVAELGRGAMGAVHRAVDPLKQKVANRSATAVGTKNAEIAARIDAGLRAAFRYLSEFSSMLNDAKPVSEGKQGVMFFGEVAGMILGDGFTDLRTRDLNRKACADFVTWVLGADDSFERFLKKRT